MSLNANGIPLRRSPPQTGLRPFLTILDIIRQYWTLFNNIQHYSTLFSNIRHYSTISSIIRHFFNNIRHFLKLDNILHYSTIFNVIQHFPTVEQCQKTSTKILVHIFYCRIMPQMSTLSLVLRLTRVLISKLLMSAART